MTRANSGSLSAKVSRFLHRHDEERASRPYLAYKDIRLYQLDVDSIEGTEWLSDGAISFWAEYLQKDVALRYPKAQIIFMHASVSQMLLEDQTPNLELARAACSVSPTVTHIFLPINKVSDPGAPDGGSHWSLLLASLFDGVAFHYDSLTPHNHTDALDATDRLSRITDKPLRMVEIEDAPQQTNSNDCGVYVCMLMKHLLVTRLLKAQRSEKVSMSMGGKALNAKKGRREMLNIIEELRVEGEARRSTSMSPESNSNDKRKSDSPPTIE